MFLLKQCLALSHFYYSRDVIFQESVGHDVDIETLHRAVFTKDQFRRASFIVRSEGEHERDLSRVAIIEDELVGSVRLTSIWVGETSALLLGPLVVAPLLRRRGLGSLLMEETLRAARDAGHELVLLVGDKSYYGRFNFKEISTGTVFFPAWVDQRRILGCELKQGSVKNMFGVVRHAKPLCRSKILKDR